MVNARISLAGVAAIDRIAEREGTDRSGAMRLLLAYACRFMPKGWRP